MMGAVTAVTGEVDNDPNLQSSLEEAKGYTLIRHGTKTDSDYHIIKHLFLHAQNRRNFPSSYCNCYKHKDPFSGAYQTRKRSVMFPQDNFFNSDHSSTPAVDGDVAAPPSTSYTPEFFASRQSVSRSPEDFGTSSRISLGDTNFSHSSVTESTGSSLARKGKGADNGDGDTMTARRREANRLAAQRFRSRKKGYQDSLEEKIKELEQENRALQGKLEGKNETPQRDPPSSSTHVSYDHYSWAANSHHAPPILPSSSAIHPDYMEVQHNHEFRIRHLEALNQALEEELREVREENKRLRDEFAHWRMATRDWSEEENNRPASSNGPPLPQHRSQSWTRASHPFSSSYHPPPGSHPRHLHGGRLPAVEDDSSYFSKHPDQRMPIDHYALQLPPLRAPSSGSVPHPSPPLASCACASVRHWRGEDGKECRRKRFFKNRLSLGILERGQPHMNHITAKEQMKTTSNNNM
ncbi:uncharacterized protein IAS62_006316 [Cryptococcus decagattii]|uniref:BZIP domain-containing protein n=1 Tax=Cryptococcus decagattii TaxID=1859122 RepID=A0ABZ2B5E5_9TREE